MLFVPFGEAQECVFSNFPVQNEFDEEKVINENK